MRKANYITAVLAAATMGITGAVFAAQGESTEAPAETAPIDVTAEQAAELEAPAVEETAKAADALEAAETEATEDAQETAQAEDEKADDISAQ